MPGRKNAKHWAAKVRAAAERVSAKRGGIEAMLDRIIDVDGEAKFFEVVARFCPKEQHHELESDTMIPVIGVVPTDSDAWNKHFKTKPAITVDGESGEVVNH